MKWGRRKSGSPTSIINRVFPVSWLSRLRQKGSSISETSSSRSKHIGELHKFSTPDGRFYSMDEDDAYWRISFGQERIIQQGRRSTGGINPLWCDDSDREFEFPVSSFKSLDLGEVDLPRRVEDCQKFNDMVSDIKKMKEKQKKSASIRSNVRNGDSSQPTNRNGNDLDGEISRKLRHRISKEKQQAESETGLDDGQIRVSNSWERDVFPFELDNVAQKQGHVWKPAASDSRKQPQIPPNFHLSSVKETKVRTESPDGSPYDIKESHSRKANNKSRVKTYSPRQECKIRALEDIKRARMKYKKKGERGQAMEGKTVFDSFAVMKSSYNPQKDFRDSMVEMIRERGIQRSEDLEELLACYLTLNRDEYHDLIIKVFRQVWFELGGTRPSSNTEWHGRSFDH